MRKSEDYEYKSDPWIAPRWLQRCIDAKTNDKQRYLESCKAVFSRPKNKIRGICQLL
jgi:hypothetical protein